MLEITIKTKGLCEKDVELLEHMAQCYHAAMLLHMHGSHSGDTVEEWPWGWCHKNIANDMRYPK